MEIFFLANVIIDCVNDDDDDRQYFIQDDVDLSNQIFILKINKESEFRHFIVMKVKYHRK